MPNTKAPKSKYRTNTTWKPGQNPNPNSVHPVKTITRDGYKVIEELAALDKAEATMATAIGVSPPTWQALKKRDPNIRDAIERGRARARDAYVALLQRQGKKHFVPTIFLLKSLHNFSDQGQGDDSRAPNITINLPGASRVQDYRPPLTINAKRITKTDGEDHG
jgi:hypothetical protein